MRYHWHWLQSRITELSEILESNISSAVYFFPISMYHLKQIKSTFSGTTKSTSQMSVWIEKYFRPCGYRPIGPKRNNQIHITTMANNALNLVNTE